MADTDTTRWDEGAGRDAPVRLGYLLSELAKGLRDGTVAALRPLGLEPRLFGVLEAVALHGPVSQRELGALRRVDRTTVVAMVDALEGRGLVERGAHPADRRAYALRITPAGGALLAKARARVHDSEERFAAALPAGDRRRLVELLAALLEAQPGGCDPLPSG